jgi:hypothetical protein
MIMPQDILFAGGGYAWAKYGVSSLRRAPSSRGGEELKETHSRASVGSYVERGRFVRSAASNVLRPSWMYSNDDLVTTPKSVILLEEQATQICPNPQTPASWGNTGTPILTFGQPDPWGGSVAVLIQDDDAGLNEGKIQAVTFTGDGTKAFTVAVRAGTIATISLRVRDNTAGVNRVIVNVTWNAGTTAPTLAIGQGSGTLYGSVGVFDASGNLWWLVSFSADNVVAANSNEIEVYPDSAATVGTFYFAGANAWDATYPNSWQATAATRSRDVISYPLYVAPNKNIAIYHRHIERDAPNFPATNNRLWQIGKADNTTPRLVNLKNNGNDSYTIVHDEGAASVQVSADTNPTFNDLIETRVIYTGATGVVQIGAAKSAGTETLSSASSGLTPGAVWSDVLLSINSIGAASAGRQGWIATIVATWSGSAPSMDDFRALLN